MQDRREWEKDGRRETREDTYLTSGVDDLTIVVDTIVHDMFTFRLFDSREVSLDVRRWLYILSGQRRLAYTISFVWREE
jgi:hypothetical protein